MAKLATKQRSGRINGYLAAIQATQGPPPINPFRAMREQAGITIQGFADNCGVSKQSIIRLEQGVFTDPVTKVVEYVLDHPSRFSSSGYLSYPDIVNGYYDYQKAIRARHLLLFGPMDRGLSNVPSGTHPFLALLENWTAPDGSYVGRLNPTEVAKLLCFSQSVIDHFINKPNRQQTVPAGLQEALRDNGYTRAEIENFNKSYEDYRGVLLGIAPKVEPLPVGSLKDAIMEELNV